MRSRFRSKRHHRPISTFCHSLRSSFFGDEGGNLGCSRSRLSSRGKHGSRWNETMARRAWPRGGATMALGGTTRGARRASPPRPATKLNKRRLRRQRAWGTIHYSEFCRSLLHKSSPLVWPDQRARRGQPSIMKSYCPPAWRAVWRAVSLWGSSGKRPGHGTALSR